MDQLREVLFQDVKVVRINKAYTQPEMATDLFEDDKAKLHLLLQRGSDSYREFEPQLSRTCGIGSARHARSPMEWRPPTTLKGCSNVPNPLYGVNYQTTFLNCYRWLQSSDKEALVCASEQVPLVT